VQYQGAKNLTILTMSNNYVSYAITYKCMHIISFDGTKLANHKIFALVSSFPAASAYPSSAGLDGGDGSGAESHSRSRTWLCRERINPRNAFSE
jgi:hypothetical protein